MLKSYFFIPANRIDFIKKINKINADKFVLDFEDTVSDNSFHLALKNVEKFKEKSSFFIRPKLYTDNYEFSLKNLSDLLKMGFKNLIIPKISDVNELSEINECISNKGLFSLNEHSIIILIENPKALNNLPKLLDFKGIKINGVGLGSHDYAKTMGMKHTLENLYFARFYILNIAKTYEIEPIDIASMNISDEIEFDKEIKSGFELGFESKFIIHPFQLTRINEFKYYDEEEISEAKLIFEKINQSSNESLDVIKIGGKVIEKPHLSRILKIIEWSNKHGI